MHSEAIPFFFLSFFFFVFSGYDVVGVCVYDGGSSYDSVGVCVYDGGSGYDVVGGCVYDGGSAYDDVGGCGFFFFISYIYKSSVYLKQCCNMTFDKK